MGQQSGEMCFHYYVTQICPSFVSLLVVNGVHINNNNSNFTSSYLMAEARPSTPCWGPTNISGVCQVLYSVLPRWHLCSAVSDRHCDLTSRTWYLQCLFITYSFPSTQLCYQPGLLCLYHSILNIHPLLRGTSGPVQADVSSQVIQSTGNNWLNPR